MHSEQSGAIDCPLTIYLHWRSGPAPSLFICEDSTQISQYFVTLRDSQGFSAVASLFAGRRSAAKRRSLVSPTDHPRLLLHRSGHRAVSPPMTSYQCRTRHPAPTSCHTPLHWQCVHSSVLAPILVTVSCADIHALFCLLAVLVANLLHFFGSAQTDTTVQLAALPPVVQLSLSSPASLVDSQPSSLALPGTDEVVRLEGAKS